MNNNFQRLISSIGEEAFKNLQNKRVAVIGLGGVGSYAFEVIVRSGINNILIIDKDIIDETNINRQLLALNSTVGMSKVELASKRGLDINSSCNIVKHNVFLSESNLNLLDDFKPDYVIDCIDSINSKYELIKYCLLNDITILSSMGTAKKFYPEKLKITTIDKTSVDPIARIIRKKLKDDKINKKFLVVFSDEIPTESKDNILSSNAYVPSTAGILLASKVVNLILEECKDEK